MLFSRQLFELSLWLRVCVCANNTKNFLIILLLCIAAHRFYRFACVWLYKQCLSITCDSRYIIVCSFVLVLYRFAYVIQLASLPKKFNYIFFPSFMCVCVCVWAIDSTQLNYMQHTISNYENKLMCVDYMYLYVLYSYSGYGRTSSMIILIYRRF